MIVAYWGAIASVIFSRVATQPTAWLRKLDPRSNDERAETQRFLIRLTQAICQIAAIWAESSGLYDYIVLPRVALQSLLLSLRNHIDILANENEHYGEVVERYFAIAVDIVVAVEFG